MRGELEKALHLTKDLQARQEDLKFRSAQAEQQTKKLEQLAAKLETDGSTRYLWMQKSFETQDAKVSARLDDLAKAMEALKKKSSRWCNARMRGWPNASMPSWMGTKRS